MKALLVRARPWLPFLLGLQVALSCASLPRTPYGKAEAVKAQVEPVLLSVLVLVAEAPQVAQAQAAFDAVGQALHAWRQGDQEGFNAALPCAVGALENAAKALPAGKHQTAVAKAVAVLSQLSPPEQCLPALDYERPEVFPLIDEDAGAAQQNSAEPAAPFALRERGGNPLSAWRSPELRSAQRLV